MYMKTKRYQIYLYPYSVSVLDDFEKIANISRSKLIREAVDRLASQIVKVFAVREWPSPKMAYFDKLVGAINLKTRRPTNFALEEDEVYLKD